MAGTIQLYDMFLSYVPQYRVVRNEGTYGTMITGQYMTSPMGLSLSTIAGWSIRSSGIEVSWLLDVGNPNFPNWAPKHSGTSLTAVQTGYVQSVWDFIKAGPDELDGPGVSQALQQSYRVAKYLYGQRTIPSPNVSW